MGAHRRTMQAFPAYVPATPLATPFFWDGEVRVVNILDKPAASKNAIGKPNGTQLKVSVTAAPEDGKATGPVVRFLASLFSVPVNGTFQRFCCSVPQ